MHAFWDACVDQYGSLWSPLSTSDWAQLSKQVNNLTTHYPRPMFTSRLTSLKPEEWAKESNEIAKRYVYKGIQPSSTPSAEYVNTGRDIVNQ